MSGVDIEGLKDYKSLFLYPQHWAGLVFQGRFYCYGWYGNGNGRWDIKKILGILWERSGFFTLRGALLLVSTALDFSFYCTSLLQAFFTATEIPLLLRIGYVCLFDRLDIALRG